MQTHLERREEKRKGTMETRPFWTPLDLLISWVFTTHVRVDSSLLQLGQLGTLLS